MFDASVGLLQLNIANLQDITQQKIIYVTQRKQFKNNPPTIRESKNIIKTITTKNLREKYYEMSEFMATINKLKLNKIQDNKMPLRIAQTIPEKRNKEIDLKDS